MNNEKALPATDLSGAFAKPSSRAAGLRLPAKKAPQVAKPPAQRPVSAVPDPEATEEPKGAQNRPERSGRSGSKPKKSTSSGKQPPQKAAAPQRPAADQARLVLWTPKPIRARMQALRNAKGTVYRDQVLDALEACVDELPKLVAQAASTKTVQGKLFERETPTTEEAEKPDRVQLTIGGFLQSQLDVIDQLAQTHDISKSALINAALDRHLPKRD